jgi:subtilisin family serine protease
MDGTSMATPHVAGCAALLMAARPEAPVADIIRALKETAAHPGGAALRPDNRWGFGLVRPAEALAAL